jgi:diacylglycerol O-acyltransferase/trehalose O-mycolyltransferase
MKLADERTGRGVRNLKGGALRVLLWGLAALAGLISLPAAAEMPTAADCAAGQGEGVTLGEHPASAAACASGGGHVVAYAGGNALLPCGTIVVADRSVASDDPNECDTLLDLPIPDTLEFGVVLPSDYASSAIRYPTLYLLTASTEDEWPSVDPHLQGVADMGVIIVLPARGYGFYNDWFDGQHHFETLYTKTLIDAVDSQYRTIADRFARAVAGVSKAGYGAMLFASRHPDLYAAAASFSGIVDIAHRGFPLVFTTELAPAFERNDDLATDAPGTLDDPIWGNPITEAVWWHDKNPTDLATNLRGISLYESAGDGVPTSEELMSGGPTVVLGSDTEAEVRQQSDAFHRALERASIAHTYVRHVGTHNYFYWVPEMHEWAKTMMIDTFNHPSAPPAAFDYRSADPSFSVWGWSFHADPARAMEFLDVEQALDGSVTLIGSGTTTVETAPLFSPGQTVTVSDDAGEARDVVADGDGRITFSATLGTAHTTQQYTAAALVPARLPGYFTRRVVTFKPAP